MTQKLASVIFAFVLWPALAFAEAELRGTVVKLDKAQKQILVKTDKGEETLLFGSSSKGMDHAKEGAKISIKYSEKDGQPRVVAITPLESGTVQIAPR